MTDFLRLLGMALVIFSFFAPMTYSLVEREKSKDRLRIECIEVGGDMKRGECVPPEAKQ